MGGSKSRWPVIVESLNVETATAIYCASCGWTGTHEDPSEGPISDVGSCPECKLSGTLDYCYEPGERCVCGKLAIDLPYRDDYGRYCSRPCLLQAEYARGLAP